MDTFWTTARLFAVITMIPILLFLTVAIQAAQQGYPPQILLIAREPLKAGHENAYMNVEEDMARSSARLGCPHPYLAAESLSGPKEVWWFNGFNSMSETQQVGEAYRRNKPFFEALQAHVRRKADFAGKPVETYFHYRADLTTGDPWILGHGRFLVITVFKDAIKSKGTVFEADGGFYAIASARTLKEAEGMATATNAKVFAVRPALSFPSTEWVASDPEFWRSR